MVKGREPRSTHTVKRRSRRCSRDCCCKTDEMKCFAGTQVKPREAAGAAMLERDTQVPLFSEAHKGQVLLLLLIERRNTDFSALAAYAGPFGPLSRTTSAGAQLPTVEIGSDFSHWLQSYQSMPSYLSSRCTKIVPPGVTGIFPKVFTG